MGFDDLQSKWQSHDHGATCCSTKFAAIIERCRRRCSTVTWWKLRQQWS